MAHVFGDRAPGVQDIDPDELTDALCDPERGPIDLYENHERAIGIEHEDVEVRVLRGYGVVLRGPRTSGAPRLPRMQHRHLEVGEVTAPRPGRREHHRPAPRTGFPRTFAETDLGHLPGTGTRRPS